MIIKNRWNGKVIFDGDLANLYGANLYGANLREADLYGANLRGADLREADLYGANLREADLYGANLREANLYGANLREADLREAGLVVYGFNWYIQITKNYMRIGCQSHDISKWRGFSDKAINEMDSSALEFWNENKEIILKMCERFEK